MRGPPADPGDGSGRNHGTRPRRRDEVAVHGPGGEKPRNEGIAGPRRVDDGGLDDRDQDGFPIRLRDDDTVMQRVLDPQGTRARFNEAMRKREKQ